MENENQVSTYMLFVVIFTNQASISVPARSKDEARELALRALEQSSGLTREEICPIDKVELCH